MAALQTPPHLGERQVALVREGSVDQLRRISLVFVRVAELRAAHLDDGTPTPDVVAQLLLPYPVLQRFRGIPCMGAGGRLEESSETICNRLKRSLAPGISDIDVYRCSTVSSTRVVSSTGTDVSYTVNLEADG